MTPETATAAVDLSADAELCARWVRPQFPALARTTAEGHPLVYFDGPGGSQVPQRVIDAVAHALGQANANRQGDFLTSRESDEVLDEAHVAVADLLGAGDPEEIVFGANMTTLCFALSRSMGRTWSSGDEIVVTRLDHDANVRPWMLAARDAGARVLEAPFRTDDCTLDLERLAEIVSPRTKLIAVCGAANSVGTKGPVPAVVELAREVGARVVVDAVHQLPHDAPNVEALGCDALLCSAYKCFGPHVGMLWGRRELLESLEPYKLRPAPDALPGSWMTGTQNHEGIAGTLEAVRYLEALGAAAARSDGQPDLTSRREALAVAYRWIERWENRLFVRLLGGLASLPGVRLWGIAEPSRMAERVPTAAITVAGRSSGEVSRRLGDAGFCVWWGNFYASQVTEDLGLEPDGLVRIGLLHYNTMAEVDGLLAELERIVG